MSIGQYKNIIFEKKDGIAKITLNRPEALNALTRDMVIEIGYALEDIERDASVRVVIITGTGKASFCGGADIQFVTQEITSLGALQEFFRFANKTLINGIENLSKPVIAALNGDVQGGGFEIMLACDLVIASEEAFIGDLHINLGLVGPGGGTQRTPRIVGIRKAKEIIFLGERISAKEAERIGLINRAVPFNELEKATHEMAAKLAEKSPVALRIAKTLLNRALETDLVTAQELEVMSALVNCTSEDSQEGMKAISENRKPVFKGK
jgi:enoyl-CoA hydratase/carnithine racemase